MLTALRKTYTLSYCKQRQYITFPKKYFKIFEHVANKLSSFYDINFYLHKIRDYALKYTTK